jgi:sigma-B regulation protein RsbU (phosphoserine phosphatase)
VLVLYSDGISEAQDTDHREFGEERLFQAARQGIARGGANAVRAEIVDAVNAFVGGAAQFDDMTLLVTAREGDGAREDAS